jgi:hypothetical protein
LIIHLNEILLRQRGDVSRSGEGSSTSRRSRRRRRRAQLRLDRRRGDNDTQERPSRLVRLFLRDGERLPSLRLPFLLLLVLLPLLLEPVHLVLVQLVEGGREGLAGDLLGTNDVGDGWKEGETEFFVEDHGAVKGMASLDERPEVGEALFSDVAGDGGSTEQTRNHR